MLKKALFLLLSVISVSAYANDASASNASENDRKKYMDMSDYMVGTFSVDGFDTAAEEKYKANITIEKTSVIGTSGKGKHQRQKIKMDLNKFTIEHSKNSGLGTYYGFISNFKNDTLTIDYVNAGRQRHKVTCEYHKNDQSPISNCKGSWLGNVGGDGTFVMVKN